METATFLTQVLGIPVDSSAAAALEEQTEGWVTGLRLAALSMRHQGSLDPRLLEPQADAQYVMEYFFAEVFSKQPPEINQYLINSAILDRFCGPLCEAVYMPGAEPFAGKIGGWEFIAWLKNENMFLIPLDAENRWFRFHHLFRNLLLNQLRRRLGPENINGLHTRASVWFAENGLIEEVIKHALDGGNSAAAARLVTQHGFTLVSEEKWMTLVRWLKLLPNDIINQDPALVILVARTHLVHSREAELVSSLDRAEARLQKQNVAVDYIENILAAFREDVHGALPDASNHSHFPDSSISQSSNALIIPTSLRGVGPHGPYGPEAAFPIPPSRTPHHPVIPSPSPWSNP